MFVSSLRVKNSLEHINAHPDRPIRRSLALLKLPCLGAYTETEYGSFGSPFFLLAWITRMLHQDVRPDVGEETDRLLKLQKEKEEVLKKVTEMQEASDLWISKLTLAEADTLNESENALKEAIKKHQEAVAAFEIKRQMSMAKITELSSGEAKEMLELVDAKKKEMELATASFQAAKAAYDQRLQVFLQVNFQNLISSKDDLGKIGGKIADLEASIKHKSEFKTKLKGIFDTVMEVMVEFDHNNPGIIDMAGWFQGLLSEAYTGSLGSSKTSYYKLISGKQITSFATACVKKLKERNFITGKDDYRRLFPKMGEICKPFDVKMMKLFDASKKRKRGSERGSASSSPSPPESSPASSSTSSSDSGR